MPVPAAPGRATPTTGWRRPAPLWASRCRDSRSPTSPPPRRPSPSSPSSGPSCSAPPRSSPHEPNRAMSWLDGDDDADETPYSDYDESSARVRPNPRGTRPRSKQRPEHADAERGRVLTVDRGRVTVLLGEGTENEREVSSKRARELGRNSIVTGDYVDVVGDTSGDEGTLSRVVRIAERSTLLRRSAEDTDDVERIIVANADQMMIFISAANPEPRARLVDRYLVAAFDAGLDPLLVVTKTDLADPAPFLAEFDVLNLDVVTSTREATPLVELQK